MAVESDDGQAPLSRLLFYGYEGPSTENRAAATLFYADAQMPHQANLRKVPIGR